MVSSLVLTAALTICASVTVFAWEKYVPADGGMWRYGLSGSSGDYMGYSYYHHDSRAHRSSVALEGNLSRSAVKSPGYTSCAHAYSSWDTNVQAYHAIV